MIFWKIYFYFIVVVAMVSFLKEEFNTFFDYLNRGSITIGVFGLFLYVFKEKCFNIWFWRVYFVYFLIANFSSIIPGGVEVSYLEHFFVGVVLIPYIIALFSYAFLRENEEGKDID